ncbi:stress responsive A/B barrel domain-containing protein [Pyrenochaeta sp. MPI-SDFR-AT-0127]|nr:stress responsive A/B barrel domain-containing protein [Pyrenochaeta sp. MPI-SDFR-AT-0127]
MPAVRRITLFKVPNEEDQQKLLGMYSSMQSKAKKGGEAYILSVEAGITQQDQRAQGYTIVATSTFKSKEDFDYYDKECKAHDELRTFARSVQQGFCMVYFELS